MEMSKIKIAMKFTAENVTKPITYHLIKDYNLLINILNADVSLNKTGKLIADIEGRDEDIKSGLEFLGRHNVEYKILQDIIVLQEDSCVHCGACTAVCPTGALSMNTEDWSLTFDQEKCMVCRLCIKACPLRVLRVSDNGVE